METPENTQKIISNKQTVFFTRLTASNAAIKAERANIACSKAENGAKRFLSDIDDKINIVIEKIMNLEDINTSSITSTNPVGDKFTESWFKDLCILKSELKELNDSREIVVDTYNHWFGK